MPLLLVVLAALLFPALAHGQERIVGGEAVSGTMPPVVALVEKRESAYWGYFCAGNLIASRWVLTAKHCLEYTKAKDVDVVLGRKRLSTRKGKRIAASKIIRHKGSDTALIFLSRASKRKTAKIGKHPALPGKVGRVAGWGATKNFYPRTLRQVSIPIRENDVCKDAYDWQYRKATMLCAGESGKDACWGDSGSALFVDGKIVGIVSFGYRCGLKDFPGAYVRADILRKWISYHKKNPPKKYKRYPPGKDTKKKPKPYLYIDVTTYTDEEIPLNEVSIYTQSNFTITKAIARFSGEESFCRESGCIESGKWFSLPLGEGRRHAETYFADSTTGCPKIELYVEIKNKKRPRFRETVDTCSRTSKIIR
jgi:trypsin